MKDETIYVFICAESNYRGRTFKYCRAYSIGKDVNFDDIRDRLTKDMNECFEEYYFDEINPLPLAVITSMNEISKELYERLCQ